MFSTNCMCCHCNKILLEKKPRKRWTKEQFLKYDDFECQGACTEVQCKLMVLVVLYLEYIGYADLDL